MYFGIQDKVVILAASSTSMGSRDYAGGFAYSFDSDTGVFDGPIHP